MERQPERQSRVLLVRLARRVSARGNDYWSGWLGASGVVGFAGEPDEEGRETIDLFLSERRASPKQRALPLHHALAALQPPRGMSVLSQRN
jgi:hypothetical protein